MSWTDFAAFSFIAGFVLLFEVLGSRLRLSTTLRCLAFPRYVHYIFFFFFLEDNVKANITQIVSALTFRGHRV